MTRAAALLDSHTTRYYGYDAGFGKVKEQPSSSPTIQQVALKWLKEAGGVKNMVFKFSAVTFDIAGLWNPSNPSFKNSAAFAKDAKNYSEVASLPNAASELNKRFWKFLDEESLEAFGGFVRKLSEFFVPFADVAKVVSNRIVPLSSRFLAPVCFVGAASTVVAMSFGIDEELNKIQKANGTLGAEESGAQKEEAQAQITNSYLVVARNLHYQALGAFSVAATLTRTLAPAPLMVALAAGGLFFTIIGHFHAQLTLEPAKEALKAGREEI